MLLRHSFLNSARNKAEDTLRQGRLIRSGMQCCDDSYGIRITPVPASHDAQATVRAFS
jgi:hypothetical protein